MGHRRILERYFVVLQHAYDNSKIKKNDLYQSEQQKMMVYLEQKLFNGKKRNN